MSLLVSSLLLLSLVFLARGCGVRISEYGDIEFGQYFSLSSVLWKRCAASGYDENRYFPDPVQRAVAAEINCGRVPDAELLAAVADRINRAGNEHMTLIWWAYLARDPASFEALLKAGADATLPLEDPKRQLVIVSTITETAEHDPPRYAMLEAWLKLGGDPNFMPSEGSHSLLSKAAGRDFPKVAALLLRHGADPNMESGFGLPLSIAKDSAEAFKVIYEAGGSWDLVWRNAPIIKGEELPAPLELLCGEYADRIDKRSRESQFEVIRFLHEKGEPLPEKCLNRIPEVRHGQP